MIETKRFEDARITSPQAIRLGVYRFCDNILSMAKKTYNIYCDESCHLLNDHNKTFVLGAIWVEKNKTAQMFEDIRALKVKHKISASFEAKWTKVSDSKADFYCDLVRYFFDNADLHFRGLVVPNKAILDHSAFAQDHNTWYYKMFYVLLNVVINRVANNTEYNLFLDIKDTKSNVKVLELKRILNIAGIEDVLPVAKAQQIRSHEVEIMQLVDLLIGALSYAHRGLGKNQGKNKIIKVIEEKTERKIKASSERNESKFNVLVWKPKR